MNVFVEHTFASAGSANHTSHVFMLLERMCVSEIIHHFISFGPFPTNACSREMFTDADNFGISFPLDLDVKVTVCPDPHKSRQSFSLPANPT